MFQSFLVDIKKLPIDDYKVVKMFYGDEEFCCDLLKW